MKQIIFSPNNKNLFFFFFPQNRDFKNSCFLFFEKWLKMIDAISLYTDHWFQSRHAEDVSSETTD